MATVIEAYGSTIKVDKTFVSGKDQVTIDGEVVFEGKLASPEYHKIPFGGYVYLIRTESVNKLTETVAIHLTVLRGEDVLHEAMYDQDGNQISELRQAMRPFYIQMYGMVGGVSGFAVASSLLFTNIGSPGWLTGAIVGGIGGGIGGGLGGALGWWRFGRRSGESASEDRSDAT